MKHDTYKGFDITSTEHEDEHGKKIYTRSTFKKGVHFLSDTRTVDGVLLRGLNHAIQDAKIEIDILERLREI